MKSVFQENEWRNNRHFLNPSKFKEYELHTVGLGLLNNINPLKDYLEKFTPLDVLSEDEILKLNKKTTLYLIRKEISTEETQLLEKNKFKLTKEWATLILDLTKPLNIDKGNISLIKKGMQNLTFSQLSTIEELKEYHELFKNVRKSEGMKTPRFEEYQKVFNNKYYKVFVAKNRQGKIVAGIGTIANNEYALQLNIARDKDYKYASDYLTFMIVDGMIKNGLKLFDFAGINPKPEQDSKDYFIRKYKEKWGGEYYNEYTYTR